MANDSTSVSNEEFLELAIRQGLLTPEKADEMSRIATESNLSLSTVCIEQGALRPVQVDVIHGLAEADNLAPGYEVIDLLGYGGLGIVYRVRQPKLDRMVALKTIPMHRIENPSIIARFKQEAMAVGRLKHPNIVAAYDFGTHRDRLFLAMEQVEGTDLDQLIKKSGQLSAGVAWALAQQAAAGLAHAAQHNLVHRDIKPGNLLLTKPPAGYPLPPGVPLLKITDFGLVQLESQEIEGTRLTMGGTSLGTPHYMAPEQVADAHVDSRADIYALGATVYHMLVGEPPFNGKTMGQVLAAKLKGDDTWIAKLPAGTSQQAVELLKRMLAQDPADRIGDYDSLLNRIKLVLNTAPAAGVNSEAETLVNLQQTDSSLEFSLSLSSLDGSRKRRNWWLSGALVAMLALGCGFYFVSPFRVSQPTHVSPLVPSGWESPLYNGTSLSGWTPHGGTWNSKIDDMGGRILAGSNGSIVHGLPPYAASPSQPLKYFGVRLKIDLQSAQAAELHFEHENSKNKKLPRSVVRMTNAGVTLGEKTSRDADFNAIGPLVPFTTSEAAKEESHYHELRLERHTDHWQIQLNGKPICSKAIEREQPTETIQLRVAGGQAHFADLFVFELVDEQR